MATDRKRRKIQVNKTKAEKPKKTPKIKVHTNDNDENGGVSRLKVLNGTKKRRKIIRIISYSVIAAVVVALIVVNALTPTGLIETLQNNYTALGSGSFPIKVYATNASYLSSWNNNIAIVNDTFFEVYNDSGKLMQAVSHGMSNPQLEFSEERYLLFDRNRYNLSVYNYSDELYSREFDNIIVSADIGRDGTYAVAVDSDTYQNTVRVYNKDNESICAWNLANYYVTDVAVSNNGDNVAVSLIDSKDGAFQSYLYIYDIQKNSPIFTYTFSEIVSSLTCCGDNYLLLNGFDRAYAVNWEGGAELNLNINGTVRCYDNEVSGLSCIAFGRADNEQVNSITVLGETGNIISSFQINNIITDISMSEDMIVVLSSNNVYCYNLNGELVDSYDTALKGRFVAVNSSNNIFLLNNTDLINVN